MTYLRGAMKLVVTVGFVAAATPVVASLILIAAYHNKKERFHAHMNHL